MKLGLNHVHDLTLIFLLKFSPAVIHGFAKSQKLIEFTNLVLKHKKPAQNTKQRADIKSE